MLQTICYSCQSTAQIPFVRDYLICYNKNVSILFCAGCKCCVKQALKSQIDIFQNIDWHVRVLHQFV